MTAREDPQPGRTPHLRTVLIASSLQKDSNPVVGTGTALARAAGAKVYLLHAVPLEPVTAALDAGWIVPGVFQEEAERCRRQLWDQADRLQVDADELAGVEVISGPPHRAIADTARRIGADLIVMGAGETRRLGSTTDRVVRQAACPVLVVRGDLPVPPRRVLLPVDLSEISAGTFRCGLDLLGQLAAGVPAEIEAFYALDFLAPLEFLHPDMPWVTTSRQVERTAARELERFVRQNSSVAHAPVRARIQPGDASGEILAELERERPDLVILGTHGRSGFQRLLLGSIAADVLCQAPCSVLIIPPTASCSQTVPEARTLEPCQSGLLPFDRRGRRGDGLHRRGASLRAAILTLILFMILPAADVLAAIPVSERAALVALYDSTKGIPWKRGGTLGPPGSECGWFGVTCDAGGTHVIGLRLEERNISGTLPEALGDLSELQILDLSGNALSGPNPASLGRMSQLSRLVLGGNQLSGSIPSELAQLSHLTQPHPGGQPTLRRDPSRLGRSARARRVAPVQQSTEWNHPRGAGPAHESAQLGARTEPSDREHPRLAGKPHGSSQSEAVGQPAHRIDSREPGQIDGPLLSDGQEQRAQRPCPSLAGRPPDPPVAGPFLEQALRPDSGGPQPAGHSAMAPPGRQPALRADSSIDLRWNALSADPATAAFVNDRQRDGQSFLSTQTLPPRSARVAGATKRSLTLVWNPIRYRADDGFYSVFVARNPPGPFHLAARVSPKSAGSFTLTGLAPATTYYFRIRAVTRPHPHNPNSVLSLWGPAFSGATKRR